MRMACVYLPALGTWRAFLMGIVAFDVALHLQSPNSSPSSPIHCAAVCTLDSQYLPRMLPLCVALQIVGVPCGNLL